MIGRFGYGNCEVSMRNVITVSRLKSSENDVHIATQISEKCFCLEIEKREMNDLKKMTVEKPRQQTLKRLVWIWLANGFITVEGVNQSIAREQFKWGEWMQPLKHYKQMIQWHNHSHSLFSEGDIFGTFNMAHSRCIHIFVGSRYFLWQAGRFACVLQRSYSLGGSRRRRDRPVFTGELHAHMLGCVTCWENGAIQSGRPQQPDLLEYRLASHLKKYIILLATGYYY